MSTKEDERKEMNQANPKATDSHARAKEAWRRSKTVEERGRRPRKEEERNNGGAKGGEDQIRRH
jgi:ubiquitin